MALTFFKWYSVILVCHILLMLYVNYAYNYVQSSLNNELNKENK